MERVDNFSLMQHAGAYEDRPLKTPLLYDGEATGVSLPGYDIRGQYRCNAGYLIITDWDCPFEEMNEFILLDQTFRKLSHRSIRNYLVSSHWPIAENALRVHFIEQIVYTITVERPRGLFRRKPWLNLTEMDLPESDPVTKAAIDKLAKDLDDIRASLQKSDTNASTTPHR